MDQQQQSRWQPTRRQFLWAGAVVGLLTIAILIGYRYDVTLWDWIKLLVVPAVIAGGGLWFNRQLQEQKSRDELLNAMAQPRVRAYEALWGICKQVRFANDEKITNENRSEIERQLGEWYWKEGNAMYLSWTSSLRLMEARNRLRIIKHKTGNHETDAKQETTDIKDAFSALRTELKYDCGIISSEEKTKYIGDLKDWDRTLKP